LLPTPVTFFPAWWHKRKHYTHGGAEPTIVFDVVTRNGGRQPVPLTVHFGSQWVILQRSFVEWLVRDLATTDSLACLYRDYLIDRGYLMTDETFIPSLLMCTDDFAHTLPQTDYNGYLLWKNGTPSLITDIRFERMDEHFPTSSGYMWRQQRYDVPEGSVADVPRAWGPYYLGVYDLAGIRESGALFTRKVSIHIDHNLLNILPVNDTADIPYIQWPWHVKLTEKPDWSRFLEPINKNDNEGGNGVDEGEEEEEEEL
jgi:Core-2/I-Branching enzyme